MLTLRQYTTSSCAVCKAHRPMLAEIEKMFDGEMQIEFIDVASLSDEEASTINTVPFYKLVTGNTVHEIWFGTKSKEKIIDFIESALAD